MIQNRSWSAGNGYRYGFNGQEKDDKVKGRGNSLDFGARIYVSRLGRFLSTDPMSNVYTSWSPYCFAGNYPTIAIDYDGMGPIIVVGSIHQSVKLEAALENGDVYEVQRIIAYSAVNDYMDDNGNLSDGLRTEIGINLNLNIPMGSSSTVTGDAGDQITLIYGVRRNEDGNLEKYLIGSGELPLFDQDADQEIDYSSQSITEIVKTAKDVKKEAIRKLEAAIANLENQNSDLEASISQNERAIEENNRQYYHQHPDEPVGGYRLGKAVDNLRRETEIKRSKEAIEANNRKIGSLKSQIKQKQSSL